MEGLGVTRGKDHGRCLTASECATLLVCILCPISEAVCLTSAQVSNGFCTRSRCRARSEDRAKSSVPLEMTELFGSRGDVGRIRTTSTR